MKYTFKAPPSKTEQTLTIDIPDLPTSITPVITGTTPIDNIPPDPIPTNLPFKIEGFGQTKGGSDLTPTKVSTAADIIKYAKSNVNMVITKGGTYNVRLELSNVSNLTIDATQADGPVIFDNKGNGGCVIFDQNCHDIIVRGIAVRNAGDDGAAVNNAGYKICFDHCSFQNNGDGNIDVTNSHDITIQWCLIGNSVSGASLIDYPGTKNVSIHHCAYIGGFERNPLIGSQQKPGRADLVCDFRNNVVSGWQNYGTDVNNNGTANVVNNWYGSGQRAIITAANSYGNYPQGFAYVAGNVSSNGTDLNKVSNHSEWPVPLANQIEMQDAVSAARLVLANAGPLKKDDTDTKLLNSVKL